MPSPPGLDLETSLRLCLDWAVNSPADVDPVIAAAMVHYQFEALHPFNDGNGRLGRLLVVLQLLAAGALSEPSLTVSPWFEARRREYYDRLFAVSAGGDWDGWVHFFAQGLTAAARDTDRRLGALVAVQHRLKDRVRTAGLRADTAILLVDFALTRTFFTVRQAERRLGLSYARANALVTQLIDADVLRQRGNTTYGRQFYAPDFLAALT